jgi:hypothetical protein
MRRIHPVGINEVFVASGEYHASSYADLRQMWTVHAPTPDGYLVRVDSQNAEGYDLEELVIDKSFGVMRLNRESFQKTPQGFVRYQKMSCHFAPRHISQSVWSHNDPEAIVRETTYEDDVTFMLKRWQDHYYPYVVYGWILRDLLQIPSMIDILQMGDKAVAIPVLVGEETLKIGTQELPAQKYRWLTTEIWLDTHAIPLKIEEVGGNIMTLHNYAHKAL